MTLTGCYTVAGAALAAGVLARETALVITRAVAGSGQTSENASALAQQKQQLNLLRKTASGQNCQVQAALSAESSGQEYVLREIGLYAKETGGTEVLYKLFRLDETLTVEPGTDLTVTFYLTESILPAEQVTVNLTQQGLMTQAACESAVQEAKETAIRAAEEALAAHAAATGAHSALLAQKAPLSHTHSAAQVTAGTFPGTVKAHDNTSYTVAQLRNIVLSPDAPSGGSNGQLWIQYD